MNNCLKLEIEEMAKNKLHSLADFVSKEEYDQLLRLTLKEIANDLGYAIDIKTSDNTITNLFDGGKK